jgi:hypothetical protein
MSSFETWSDAQLLAGTPREDAGVRRLLAAYLGFSELAAFEARAPAK